MDFWMLSRDHHSNNRPSGTAVDGEELVSRLGHEAIPREPEAESR